MRVNAAAHAPLASATPGAWATTGLLRWFIEANNVVIPPGKINIKKCDVQKTGASWHCSYLGTGKSPEPADKNVGATWRRLSCLRVQATFQSPVSPRPFRIIKNILKLRPKKTRFLASDPRLNLPPSVTAGNLSSLARLNRSRPS